MRVNFLFQKLLTELSLVLGTSWYALNYTTEVLLLKWYFCENRLIAAFSCVGEVVAHLVYSYVVLAAKLTFFKMSCVWCLVSLRPDLFLCVFIRNSKWRKQVALFREKKKTNHKFLTAVLSISQSLALNHCVLNYLKKLLTFEGSVITRLHLSLGFAEWQGQEARLLHHFSVQIFCCSEFLTRWMVVSLLCLQLLSAVTWSLAVGLLSYWERNRLLGSFLLQSELSVVQW